jgi:hypothetical protein
MSGMVVGKELDELLGESKTNSESNTTKRRSVRFRKEPERMLGIVSGKELEEQFKDADSEYSDDSDNSDLSQYIDPCRDWSGFHKLVPSTISDKLLECYIKHFNELFKGAQEVAPAAAKWSSLYDLDNQPLPLCCRGPTCWVLDKFRNNEGLERSCWREAYVKSVDPDFNMVNIQFKGWSEKWNINLYFKDKEMNDVTRFTFDKTTIDESQGAPFVEKNALKGVRCQGRCLNSNEVGELTNNQQYKILKDYQKRFGY